MTREHTVAVKAKSGGGVAHCAGQRFAIVLKPSEVRTTWADGSPITSTEFAEILQPTGLFEIAEQSVSSKTATK